MAGSSPLPNSPLFKLGTNFHNKTEGFVSDTVSPDRIGDLNGDKTKAYKEYNKARMAYKNEDWHNLAKTQAPESLVNDPDALKHMIYKGIDRHDGKDHASVMKGVESEKPMKASDLLNAFKGYDICSTASVTKGEPIVQSDYNDQIKLD